MKGRFEGNRNPRIPAIEPWTAGGTARRVRTVADRGTFGRTTLAAWDKPRYITPLAGDGDVGV